VHERPLGRVREIGTIALLDSGRKAGREAWNLEADEPVMSFALHVRGDSAAAAQAVAALLDRLGFRALDPQSPTGLFDADASGQSFERWRSYRDQAVESQRRSLDTEQ